MSTYKELAEHLEAYFKNAHRMDEVIAILCSLDAQPQQASKPLSYDEMWDLWNAQANDEMHQQDAIAFASAAITAFCLKNGIKERG